jgi:hypothetical protein
VLYNAEINIQNTYQIDRAFPFWFYLCIEMLEEQEHIGYFPYHITNFLCAKDT